MVLLASVLTLLLGACSGNQNDDADPLRSYTDSGDGCPQMVTAITYAEDALDPLGQEAYQDFTDRVRSGLAAVDGTQSLEVDDFPSKKIRKQAVLTGRYATAASRAVVAPRARIRNLRKFRREAAELVLLCAPYVDPTPSPSTSPSTSP
jgi:hypothetical protein